MGKNRVKYGCSQCGYEAAKWLGRCPGCGAWNTMVEEVVRNPLKELAEKRVAVPLSSIADEEVARFSSGIGELDRVLGGGVV
ncbi:MAG: DNA repair protein RadA, partial [Syntrophomonadaceae bacterium]|nr:DNA repair protein RadA [Syntrophomonadaceae bacterium]